MATTFSLDALCKIYVGQASNLPSDLVQVRSTITQSTSSYSRTQVSIAAEEEGTIIPVIGAGAAGLIILSDRAVGLNLNESTGQIELTPSTPGTKSIVFFCNAPVTSVVLSNPSDTNIATIDVIMFS